MRSRNSATSRTAIMYTPVQGIYQIINAVTGMVYIGSSVSMNQRIAAHKSKLRNNTHANKHLQSSWNKHGEPMFHFLHVELVGSMDDLNEKEAFWISALDCCDNGYNKSPVAVSDPRYLGENHPAYGHKGWMTGKKMPDETRRKISATLMGRKCPKPPGFIPWNKGIPRSDEVKEKIAAKLRGIPLNAEHRKKVGDGNRGKTIPASVRKKMSDAKKGVKFSDEHRRNLSIAMTGRIMSDETKKKLSDIFSGRVISDETRAKMSAACMGRRASDETKKKIGDAHRGEKSRFYGKPAWNQGMPGFFKGRKHSEESKSKLRIARTKKPIIVDGEECFECSRCKGVFLPVMFSKDKHKANGITSACKVCRNRPRTKGGGKCL